MVVHVVVEHVVGQVAGHAGERAVVRDDQRALHEKLARLPQATILQMIYQKKSYEGNARDYEFSHESMHEHWTNGHDDTARTLARKDWLEMPPPGVGIVSHDVHREYED